MVLDELSLSLREAFRRFTNRPYAEQQAIEEFLRDAQRSLLKSDVEVGLVLQLSDSIREVVKEKPPTGISKKDQVVHRAYLELVGLLGKQKRILDVSGPGKKRLLFVGIQGSGKTTTVAKVAKFLQRRGQRVAVICADTFRPGAYQQLSQLLQPYGIPVMGSATEKDPVKLIGEALKRLDEYRVRVIASAGRHMDEAVLRNRVEEIDEDVKLDATVLVVDATIGQQARSQAEAFAKAARVGYIILTKMDGTAKGGGAISAVVATGAPIVFIGTGEKVDDLEEFDPMSFVSDLIGIVDLRSIVRRVEAVLSVEDEERAKAMAKGKFNLEDFVVQIEAVGKPGMLASLAKMLPSSTKLPEGWEEKSTDMARVWRSILDSMNREERQDPTILNSSRTKRIAKGSGRSEREVRELVRQYMTARKLLRRMKGSRNLKLPFR